VVGADLGSISGELEGKYTDGGIALTQGWTTANALNTKIELDNQIARGVKLELGTVFLPSLASKNAKVLHPFSPSPPLSVFPSCPFSLIPLTLTYRLDCITDNKHSTPAHSWIYSKAQPSPPTQSSHTKDSYWVETSDMMSSTGN
jgi:hypothetical protein